jgi:hypothetical protein
LTTASLTKTLIFSPELGRRPGHSFLHRTWTRLTSLLVLGTSSPWLHEMRLLRKHARDGLPPRELILRAAKRLIDNGHKLDAVRLLYDCGCHREAGGLLLRYGAVAEAARVYAEGKQWEKAEACYLAVNDRMAAAHCAESAGRYDTAATLYEVCFEWESVARCYRRGGDLRRAAWYFGKAALPGEALRSFQEWVRIDASAVRAHLRDEEIDLLIDVMPEGQFEPGLFQILRCHGQVHRFVFALIRRNRMSMAAEIVESRFDDFSDDLCRWVRDHPEMAPAALMLCQWVNDRGATETIKGVAKKPDSASF